MKYVIRWVSKKTGATGQGAAVFSKEQAELIVKTLNEKEDELVHFAVSESESKQ